MKGTELIPAEKFNFDVVFTEDGNLEKIMAAIKQKIGEFEPDVETTKGRAEIASMAYKVSRSKTFLNDLKKETVRKAKPEIEKAKSEIEAAEKKWREKKAKTDKIYENWKPVETELDELRDNTRKPLTDWEAEEEKKEQERINKVKALLSNIETFFDPHDNLPTVNELKDMYAEIDALEITPEIYFEFTQEAKLLKERTLGDISSAMANRDRLDFMEAERKAESERIEAERIGLEKERASIQADNDRIAAEQKAAQDKIDEENRKIQAEKEKIEAEKRAEQERKEREEFERKAKIKAEAEAKEAAEQAEADQLAEEKRIAEEAERKSALLPDKEKLEKFCLDLEKIKFPEVESVDANGVLAHVDQMIVNIVAYMQEQIEDM